MLSRANFTTLKAPGTGSDEAYVALDLAPRLTVAETDGSGLGPGQIDAVLDGAGFDRLRIPSKAMHVPWRRGSGAIPCQADHLRRIVPTHAIEKSSSTTLSSRVGGVIVDTDLELSLHRTSTVSCPGRQPRIRSEERIDGNHERIQLLQARIVESTVWEIA